MQLLLQRQATKRKDAEDRRLLARITQSLFSAKRHGATIFFFKIATSVIISIKNQDDGFGGCSYQIFPPIDDGGCLKIAECG